MTRIPRWVPTVPGLTVEETQTLTTLVDRLFRKAERNRLRRRYYDAKQSLRDLGISVPPTIQLRTVLGWPAKAVDVLVRRTMLESWVADDETDLVALGLDELLAANQFDRELPAALTSALMHSVAFGFVTAGLAGEPAALIQFRSAEQATGEWDDRRRCLANALSVISTDDAGQPDAMNLYVPDVVVAMRRDEKGWRVDRYRHRFGVPVEAIPFRPSLIRPMGSSRITRPVMELTDAAVRTLVRTEVSAEFYNAPQRYVLGAAERAFAEGTVPAPQADTDIWWETDDGVRHRGGDTSSGPAGTGNAGGTLAGWQALLGHVWTLTRDEDGNLPSVGQFPQQSMQPNVEHFRMLAQTFAAETSIPLRSLGVVGDNPESAEAIAEANKELELEIKHWQRAAITPALKRMVAIALAIANGGSVGDYRGVSPLWARPSSVSESGAADAISKQVAAFPWLAETEVALRRLGYSPEEIVSAFADRRRAEGAGRLDGLLTDDDATPAGPLLELV